MVEGNNNISNAAADPNQMKKEKLSLVKEARDSILNLDRSSIVEIRAFANPHRDIMKVCGAMEAFVQDKETENITWAACRTGFLKDRSVIGKIEFDAVTSNQREVLTSVATTMSVDEMRRIT